MPLYSVHHECIRAGTESLLEEMPRVLATFDAGSNPSFGNEPVPANPQTKVHR